MVMMMNFSLAADAGLAHHQLRNFLDFASDVVTAGRQINCIAQLPV